MSICILPSVPLWMFFTRSKEHVTHIFTSQMWDEPIPLNRTIMQDSKTAYEENRHAALREAYSPNVTLDWLADDVSAGAVMTAKAMADKLGKAAADIPGSSSDDSLTVDADTSMVGPKAVSRLLHADD